MFEKQLEAAALIRDRGIAAANDAALLVGTPETLAMLLVILEGDDEQKIAQLRKAGLTAFADVGPGKAVIHDERGNPVRVLEIHNRKLEESGAEGLHLGMFWQGGPWIKQLFAGTPPYTELKRIVRREWREYRNASRREAEEYLKSRQQGS